jgi:hypothetical protein
MRSNSRQRVPGLGIAFLFAVAATPLAAQGPSAIGFRIGPAWATFDMDPSLEQDALSSVAGGGFLRFDIGRVALQPEVWYATKGSRYVTGGGELIFDVEVRYDYLDVPLLLVVPLLSGASITPQLHAGPALSVELDCAVTMATGGLVGNFRCHEDRRKLDVALLVGGGLAVMLGPGSALLDARYGFGLLDLEDDADPETRRRHRWRAVTVGYSMPLRLR